MSFLRLNSTQLRPYLVITVWFLLQTVLASYLQERAAIGKEAGDPA